MLHDAPPPYRVLVFDCDSTLSAIEGIDELAREHQREIAALTDRAMKGELALEDVYAKRLAIVQPTRAAVDEVGDLYVARALPHAAELVAAAHFLKKRVCIVSGGLLPAVSKLARALAIDAADVFAVDIRFDAHGAYAGYDETSPLTRSGGKLEVVRAIAAASGGPLCLVGDGSTDLEAAGEAARFIAFGGVVRRENVFARSRITTEAADMSALAPLVFSIPEMELLRGRAEHPALFHSIDDASRTPMAKNILWIPGPTEVRPELLQECARPMIGHRSKAMTALTERLDPHLKLAFGLDANSTAHVAVHTCAATGIMEASLRGVGPKVLCLVNGSFSKRYAEIAESIGKTVVKLSVPMGQAVSMTDLETTLSDKGPFDAVTLVSNETSAGVRTPLAPFAAVMKRFPNVMVLVDLVSYIAGAPVDFDQNRMDFAFAGIQKALALPPGLTVLCASQRYMEAAKNQKLRGFYLDPLKIVEGHEQRATPATPAISLYYALAKQLEDISAGHMLYGADKGKSGAAAWRARFDEHERMVKACESWAERHSLRYLAVPALRSPTVSTIERGDLDVALLIAGLKEKGHEIGNGYGDLKDKTFRIGHMGDHTVTRLDEMLALLDQVVSDLRKKTTVRG